MKKNKVVLLTCALAGMLLIGCGKAHNSAADQYQSIGTIDGQEISYSLANFAARYEQASYEKQHLEALGDEMWSTPMGSGITLEDQKKEEVLTGLEKMIILANKSEQFKIVLTTEEEANIKKKAKEFIENNSEEALEKMTATREVIEEYLRYYTLSNKVYERIANEEKDEKLVAQHTTAVINDLMSRADINIDAEAWANITFDGHFEVVTNE